MHNQTDILSSVKVALSSKDSIQVMWSVLDEFSSQVRGYEIQYQAVGSNVVQYSGLLGPSALNHEIRKLHENTAYDICVHAFTTKQQQLSTFDIPNSDVDDIGHQSGCVTGSTGIDSLRLAVGSTLGAFIALGVVIAFVMLAKLQPNKRLVVRQQHYDLGRHHRHRRTASKRPDERRCRIVSTESDEISLSCDDFNDETDFKFPISKTMATSTFDCRMTAEEHDYNGERIRLADTSISAASSASRSSNDHKKESSYAISRCSSLLDKVDSRAPDVISDDQRFDGGRQYPPLLGFSANCFPPSSRYFQPPITERTVATVATLTSTGGSGIGQVATSCVETINESDQSSKMMLSAPQSAAAARVMLVLSGTTTAGGIVNLAVEEHDDDCEGGSRVTLVNSLNESGQPNSFGGSKRSSRTDGDIETGDDGIWSYRLKNEKNANVSDLSVFSQPRHGVVAACSQRGRYFNDCSDNNAASVFLHRATEVEAGFGSRYHGDKVKLLVATQVHTSLGVEELANRRHAMIRSCSNTGHH